MDRFRSFVYTCAVICIASVGCSSPTSPTPTPVAVTPPVVSPPVVTPPILVPPPAFPPNDPRFDLAFYRELAHNALDGPIQPLRHRTEAPRIYLRTSDDAGSPMDAFTLDQTAAAIERTTGQLTGVFGIAALERGTDTREGQPGWITVRWSAVRDGNVCGRAAVAGDLMTFYPKGPCRCGGGPAVAPRVIKHELGHALGFWHTDSRADLMFVESFVCDQDPTPRELYHFRIAYGLPNGMPAP